MRDEWIVVLSADIEMVHGSLSKWGLQNDRGLRVLSRISRTETIREPRCRRKSKNRSE